MLPELTPILKGLYSCDSCTARKEATTPVGSSGCFQDKWIMVVGRNPGKSEDEQCKPFVGRSGRFLDSYLLECGLSRDEVYVTNTIKCHTKQNREPDILEIKTCTELWLHKEYRALQPRLIFILGNDAYRGIFGYNLANFIESSGRIKEVSKMGYNEYIVILPHPSAVITYHPDWKKKYDDTVGSVKAIIKKIKEEL